MKKWLAYLSAIMCMVLVLCGCGTEADETVISDSMKIVEDVRMEELENMEDEIGDTEEVIGGGTDESDNILNSDSEEILEENCDEDTYPEATVHSFRNGRRRYSYPEQLPEGYHLCLPIQDPVLRIL